MQTLPVPVCVLDRLTGVYLEANPAFARLLGLKREQILQKNGSELPAGLSDGNLKHLFSQLENGDAVRSIDLIIFQASGKVIRSGVQAQWVDFSGREAIMLSFDTLPDLMELSALEIQEAKVHTATRLSQSLANQDDPETILGHLAASTFEVLPESCAVVLSLVDLQRCCVTRVYIQHAGEPMRQTNLPEMSYNPAGPGLMNEVLRSGRPLETDQQDERQKSALTRLGMFTPGKIIQSAITVPMTASGTIVGVLQVFSFQPNRFTSHAAILTLLANTAANAIHGARLTNSLERTSQDLNQTYDATIDGWTRALELRDFATERHTERVVSMTLELGRKIGLDDSELLRVRHGAQLHDIGKMGIPDSILLKPGALDESEWRVMRKHPVYAYELLRPIPRFGDIIDIPYCHHEKWDGSGYPRRLKGPEIPLAARIFAVVDVWDALSSNRPYRNPWPQHQVFDFIQNQSNKQFEPEITRAFLDIVKGKTAGTRTPLPGFRRPVSDSYGRVN